MADFSEDLPVDPAIDPEAPQVPSEVSSGFYDDTPVDVDPNVDPYANPIESGYPPESEIDRDPAEVDPTVDPEVEQAGPPTSLSNYYDSPDAVGPPAELSNYYDLPNAVGPPASAINTGPNPLNAAISSITGVLNGGTFNGPGFQLNPASESAAITQAFANQARQQQTLKQQRKQVNNADWRVRLRLAPGAQYLYNAPNPGILQPLRVTDGVIFPYTPTIDTVYKAEYDPYTLTHSNYKGYFYKSSYVDQVTLRCPFTAQSTAEANYLLAVITFFKSATKMFYGQDAERGSPPPLVYLSGYGEYQFNEHPSVITQFTLNLPSDVDYIRAGSPNNNGLNLTTLRDRQSTALPTSLAGLQRLANAFLKKGALPSPPSPPSLTTNNPTYVPTKMEINITLLPVQSRQQVSKQFSVREFANGNLIKGGFW